MNCTRCGDRTEAKYNAEGHCAECFEPEEEAQPVCKHCGIKLAKQEQKGNGYCDDCNY